MKNINIKGLFFLLVLMVSSCVTQKSKSDEPGKLNQFYHNMNAEFNGYFNADVIMTESYAALNNQYQDNYNNILPVYEYTKAEDPKVVAQELDRAIEKVSIVVSLHRQSDWVDDCYLLLGQAQYLKKDYESAEETFEYMMEEFNPEAMARNKTKAYAKKKDARAKKQKEAKKAAEEARKEREEIREDSKKKAARDRKEKEKERKAYNKAVKKAKKKGTAKPKRPTSKKDSDATNAAEAAKKANEEALTDEEKKAKKKKEEEEEKKKKEPKPEDENGMFKRDPAYQAAQLWLARTYIERDKFDQASVILSKLDKDPSTYKEVRAEMAPVQAYFYTIQKDYDRAIPHLEKAVELVKNKVEKARYSYILAQIYQKNKQTDKAFANFNKAMKYSNDYEMEFSAILSMAQNSYQTGKTPADQAIRNLEKMLKDAKNIDFKDQIYYALANIALNTNQRPEAINYLQQSLAFSSGNTAQRAESYLKLATLYFEEEDYVNAKNYYDSTYQVLATTDDRYNEVSRYKDNLTGIAENIEIITLQDSLLAISSLTPKERKKLASALKKENEKQKARTGVGTPPAPGFNKTGRGAFQTATAGRGSRDTGRGGIATNTGTTFPLYDERNVKKGKKDFEKRFGDRPLEDDWRRSQKEGIANILTDEEETEVVDTAISDSEIEQLLKDVPSTPEDKQKAYAKIEDAMIDLGRLFREKIERNDKTIETLEDGLLQRFPSTQHELDAWYFLYLAHTDEGNKSKAQEYLNKIVEKYPNTTYARILKDPNFLADSQSQRKKLNDYYKATYVDFEKGNYENAYNRIEKAVELFGTSNNLQARFALLSALCIGNLQGKEEYKKSLKEVIAKFPETPEQKRAKEILRLLEGRAAESGSPEANAAAAKKFSPEDDKLHYMIVVITDKGGGKVNDAKSKIASFNNKFYSLDKLRISNIYLGTNVDRPIMVIRKFKNKDKAMTYRQAALDEAEGFIPGEMQFDVYPITQNNYRQILKDKSLDGYETFFNSHYMN